MENIADDDLCNVDVVTSADFERFFALNLALSNADDSINSDDKIGDFVKRIFDLSSTGKSAERKKIGIDFSSPNIAKPFHVGHLRSTFIGRALSNLAISSGTDVVRINYLGDWGTQFGLLAVGYEKFHGDLEQTQFDPEKDLPVSRRTQLRDYFDVYVKANGCAESDAEFRRKALDYFARLENGSDEKALRFWRRVVDDSVAGLKCVYSRLGVKFDAWESERAAALPAKALLADLERRNILERNDENMLGFRVDSTFVPLSKSDGSTLYLTRDISTALHRFDQLSCRKLVYVTDKNQEIHFRQLKHVLTKIGRPDVADSIAHVRFGRIRKMSTRKGQVIFAEDLLDEGAKKAEEELLSPDPKTKAPVGSLERRLLAEQLSLSSLVINDLQHRLLMEYDFDWTNVLDTSVDSGVSLQKTFCRLSSICQRCEPSTVDLETFRRSMTEKEALQIACHLSRNLEPALRESLDNLESYPLVRHLFQLRRLCGGGVKTLRVNNAPSPALRSSRFLLFDVARKVLGLGLRLLGAKPLAKI